MKFTQLDKRTVEPYTLFLWMTYKIASPTPIKQYTKKL
jgi:hypothetical protein